MAGVTSREANIAFAKFATNSWGVAASVTRGAYWSSDGGMALRPIYVEDARFNQKFLGQAEIGDITAVDATVDGQARYDDNHYILQALFLGSPATVTISSSASGQTTSWLHVIDAAPSIDGLGVTVAMDKVLFVDELTSAKVYGFGETFGDGGVVNQSFKLLGTKMTNISSTNTRSTVNGASFPAQNNRIFRKQGTFRLNIGTGGALGASDAIPIESWDFQMDRPQDAPFVTSSDVVYEPGDNGHPQITFRVTFPRMNTVSANSMYGFLRSGTQFKADMTYNGSNINSTDTYRELWQFPAVELQEWAANVSGPNQVKPVAMFKAKLAATSPTGMAFVNPVRLSRIMVNSVVAF